MSTTDGALAEATAIAQALVGDEAWEHRDPGLFLRRQALMTKELGKAQTAIDFPPMSHDS